MSGSVVLKTCPCEGFRLQERRIGCQGQKVEARNMPKTSTSPCCIAQCCLASGPRLGGLPERAAALSKHPTTTVRSESSLAWVLMASDFSSNRQMLLEII